MKDGDKQPFTRLRIECRGNHREVLPTGFLRWLDQPNPGIATAQRPSYLALKFVHRLYRIPAGHPEKRDQRRRGYSWTRFHRERKRGVGIVGGLGLVHADIGKYFSGAAVRVLFASNLTNSAVRWRDRWNRSECWQLRCHRRNEVVKAVPLC